MALPLVTLEASHVPRFNAAYEKYVSTGLPENGHPKTFPSRRREGLGVGASVASF
ncbi:hypothetical protein BV95_00766 [Sphingobium chlorophenolicum]|uniref:Uncharacterized protein n=1 Tax=Sphingobium chlorophenolicum TaxID=46429 RepID=A0A081RI33_SPHCR|nr:hypothetical protein BV95_00766 [Sphingobium chlorophenolicum]